MRCKLACISMFMANSVYAGRQKLLVFMGHGNKKSMTKRDIRHFHRLERSFYIC